MKDINSCISACNKLLRGEISAVETYTQAIEKFVESPESITLQRIRADHEESAEALRSHIVDMGGTPDSDSGPWGGFAMAVEGAAKLFGGSPAIMALRRGEEIGISDYEDALMDSEVMEEQKSAIRQTLLPRLHAHLATLDGIPA